MTMTNTTIQNRLYVRIAKRLALSIINSERALAGLESIDHLTAYWWNEHGHEFYHMATELVALAIRSRAN